MAVAKKTTPPATGNGKSPPQIANFSKEQELEALPDDPLPEGLTVDRATVSPWSVRRTPDEGMGRRCHDIRNEKRACNRQADG